MLNGWLSAALGLGSLFIGTGALAAPPAETVSPGVDLTLRDGSSDDDLTRVLTAVHQSSRPAALLLAQQSNGDVPLFNPLHRDPQSVKAANIAEPGPDMGDFPNSAYTLPQGHLQFEMAPFSLTAKSAGNPSAYTSPFLLRYGLTDDVEFRVLGNGLTWLLGPDTTTGLAPLTFDAKIHLWDDQMEFLAPAVSLEVMLQTLWGSSAFRAGTEPGLAINMDFPVRDSTNIQATLSYSGVLTSVLIPTGGTIHGIDESVIADENVYYFSAQWALEQQVTEQLNLFVHGYYSLPASIGGSASAVVGAGLFYQLSQSSMLFGSANAGLTDAAAPLATQLGIAFRF